MDHKNLDRAAWRGFLLDAAASLSFLLVFILAMAVCA